MSRNPDMSRSVYVTSAFIVLGLMIVGISLSRVLYPFDSGHYEAVIWNPALLSITGHNPYAATKVTEPPYVMAAYGYLYYLIIGFGLKTFGAQFWFGRGLSFFASCIVIVFVGKITFLLTQKSQAVVLAVIAVLSSFAFEAWIGLQRSDLPGLAAALAGLYIAFESSREPADRMTIRVAFAAVLLASAFFFKLTIVLPTLVATARYLQSGKRRMASYTLLGAVAIIGLGAILLNSASGGGYFWQHFTLMRQITHSYSASMGIALDLLKAPATFTSLVIVIGSVVSPGLKPAFGAARLSAPPLAAVWRVLKSPRILVFFYLAAAALFAFVASARHGASANYYLEASAVGAIAVALAWDGLQKHRTTIHVLCVCLLTLTGAFQLARVARGEYFRWRSLPYYKEVVSAVADYAPPGTVCFSVYPELITAAGHEYHFGDWVQYVDGRSPELTELFRTAIEINRYPIMIWSDQNESDKFPAYHLVPMKQPPPKGFYPVYLYVLDQGSGKEGGAAK